MVSAKADAAMRSLRVRVIVILQSFVFLWPACSRRHLTEQPWYRIITVLETSNLVAGGTEFLLQCERTRSRRQRRIVAGAWLPAPK
jgi:hypothetical protein